MTTVDLGTFVVLPIVVAVVILGYFVCKFLLKCKHCQVESRRPPSELASQIQEGKVMVPCAFVSDETCKQIFTLPPSYDQCVAAEKCVVATEHPPSYDEWDNLNNSSFI